MQNLISTFTRQPAVRDNAEPTLKPQYEVKETPEAWGLTVHLPGVSREGLELTAEEGLITVRGRRLWKAHAGWTTVYREIGRAHV
jgi:HSP20 family molecular chaperone IbpA